MLPKKFLKVRTISNLKDKSQLPNKLAYRQIQLHHEKIRWFVQKKLEGWVYLTILTGK